LTKIPAVPQKIVERKTVVLKSRLDPTMARLLGEKIKGKFFVRLRFLKPKPEEIRLISFEKYYEPKIVVGGKYAIDYCRRRVYVVHVDEETREIVIAGREFKPEHLSPERPSKVIKLEGEEHFHYDDEAYFVLDRMGRDVAPEQMSYAPSEEQGVERLAEFGTKVREVEISREEEIDFLQSRIVNRPSGVEVTKEIFEVNERALVYNPMYQLTFQSVKTEKKVTLEIDGITGKITLAKPIARHVKDSIEVHMENLPNVERETAKEEPELSKLPPTEVTTKFPGKIVGDVFYIGDEITAAVGDAEIPSGTTMSQTIVIKGHLKIGGDCRIFGNIKALRDIVIGTNTTIVGNVISGGKVVIGPDSIIHGSVESEGIVEIAQNAVIEGGLHSKSSVELNQVTLDFQKVNAERGTSVVKRGDDD
jgi:cytoskeletal protein CcmA (bactofilin family)